MEVILVSTLVSAAVVVAYALWKRKEINDRGGCPVCGTPVPATRRPTSLRQSLWGGWTCEGCGTELDRHGRVLQNAN